jgi:signal transduction histidine kinase
MTIPKSSVLVVDDDSNMRESIADNLDLAGYDVVAADSGASAMEAVAKKFFDVILMDYNLTDATGIDVIKNIRKVNSESQIIMLTAHASLDTAVAAIQESVFDFLAKPVEFDRLKHAISGAVKKLRLEQENQKLLAELKLANDQLSNLNQMKSKFMSMASHDLSNSLMTLQISFEMLTHSMAPTADQKKKMDYIASGISQIMRLIEDLVDWAAIENGKFRLDPKVFSPGAMVEEAAVGPQARAQARGVALSVEAKEGLPEIRADKRRLLQVLNNLLENAIRHTPSEGSIVVSVDRQEGPDGHVRFAVRDSGEGIAEEDLPKIFKSFYQGGSGGGRLGLGLSIAQEIIEAHSGKFWVESPGKAKGATFFFSIPAA